MVCGKGSNLVAAEAERAEGDGADKLQPFANGFFYQGSGNSFKFAENALAADDRQFFVSEFMRVARAAQQQFSGVEVIAVRMGDEQQFQTVEPNAVLQTVKVSVRGEIDEKFIVDDCLRTRADVFSSLFAGIAAESAVAEHCGKSLRCRRS